MKQAGMTSHTERNGVNKQGEAQIEKNWMTRERTKEQKAKPEETGNQRSDNAKNTPPILQLNRLEFKKSRDVDKPHLACADFKIKVK